jgi:hypothetical protein
LLGREAFDEHFKHALCCTLVHEKFNSWQARAIVASMLKLSSASATQLTSAAVSVQQIYDDLLSGEETAMERDLLVQFLQMLESDKGGIVNKVTCDQGASLCVFGAAFKQNHTFKERYSNRTTARS